MPNIGRVTSVRQRIWPAAPERAALGRFYLASGLAELFNLIWPFQFAYLFMVMERPEWALVPLLLESGAVLVMNIPTGAFADRRGRKLSVIIGMIISAAALSAVPFAVANHGRIQLFAVSACFACWGLGQAFVSGAEEAWVVDNLQYVGRRELADVYFARVSSFYSLGAVGAGVLALVLLLTIDVDRGLLDELWFIAAAGMVLAAGIAASIPEHRPAPDPDTEETLSRPLLRDLLAGFKIILRSRPLLLLTIAMVIASFPEGAADDAFDMSLITKGMNAVAFAPLGIIDNLVGVIAPMIGIVLLRRLGATWVLSAFLILPAVAVSTLFVMPTLPVVIGLFILLDFSDKLWDPVAMTHLQEVIDSDLRATVTSTVFHLGGIVEMLGIGMLTLLLGEHSKALSDSIPDIVTAFSGEPVAIPPVPVTALGLSIPDLAIVLFAFSSLAALPFLLAKAHRRSTRPHLARPGSSSFGGLS